MSPINGGCYCGKVRFRASGPSLYQANCHCANCRRAAGAQAVAWITVKLAEFAWEKGEPKRYTTDTGAYRTFCDSCGTSLTYENDERPNEIDITTGSLDDPEHFPPNRDVFPEEKLSWVASVDGSKRWVDVFSVLVSRLNAAHRAAATEESNERTLPHALGKTQDRG